MGILQKFVTFAEGLGAEEREHLENMLHHFMTSHGADVTLTPEQEAEDDRRFNDSNPKYATQAEIDAVCGRPMPS